MVSLWFIWLDFFYTLHVNGLKAFEEQGLTQSVSARPPVREPALNFIPSCDH